MTQLEPQSVRQQVISEAHTHVSVAESAAQPITVTLPARKTENEAPGGRRENMNAENMRRNCIYMRRGEPRGRKAEEAIHPE